MEAEIQPVKRKNYRRYHGDGDSIRAKPRQRPVTKEFLVFKPSKASRTRITSCAKLQLVTGERRKKLINDDLGRLVDEGWIKMPS